MKTCFCFDQCGEADVRFFELEGDYSHLNQTYISCGKSIGDEKELNDLIRTVFQEGASDLHLSEGKRPTIRVSGMLLPLVKREIISHEMISGILSELITKENKEI